jgi:hypothetical protein
VKKLSLAYFFRRRYAILFTATLLSVWKCVEMDADKPDMVMGFIVDNAIEDAVLILERFGPSVLLMSSAVSKVNQRGYANSGSGDLTPTWSLRGSADQAKVGMWAFTCP